MKINRALNLVIPLYDETESTDKDGKPVPPHVMAYVHATPISSEIYDAHWRVLDRTYTALMEQGLLAVGPRSAGRMLREVARELGLWERSDGARLVLIPEMRRLTNVMAPGPNGWNLTQFDDAVKAGVISAEDAEEVEGILCFFTSSYRIYPHRHRREMLAGSLALWGAQIESLDCTEYLSSLRTSMAGASSGG